MTTVVAGDALAPGSAEWRRMMTASKVPSVLGLSPFKSRFTLWHEMAGTVDPEPENDAMVRGRVLEPAVAAWFALQHPEASLQPCQTHVMDGWLGATPDRLVDHERILQIKTTTEQAEWGRSGTDEVPPGVRAQVMTELAVVGLRIAHIAVLLPYLEFREYVVEYDEAEAVGIVAACREFMDSLRDGRAPGLDGSMSTYITVRQLHPDIDDALADIDPDLASLWITARTDVATYEAVERGYRSRLADAMGSARSAVCNGWTLGSRTAKGDGVPYFVASRSLPTPEQVLDPKPRKDAA